MFAVRRHPQETQRAAEERHARAERVREKLFEEKLARLAKAKIGREVRWPGHNILLYIAIVRFRHLFDSVWWAHQ